MKRIIGLTMSVLIAFLGVFVVIIILAPILGNVWFVYIASGAAGVALGTRFYKDVVYPVV